MNRMFTLCRTLGQLGARNLMRYGYYRLLLLSGILARLRVAECPLEAADLFRTLPSPASAGEGARRADEGRRVQKEANKLLSGKLSLFFHQDYQTTSPPNWFVHPEYASQKHWTKIPVNQTPGQDVKLTWDLSRFHWLQVLAAAYEETDRQDYLQAMNVWCRHWMQHNPANYSINWVCAQECAIRLIHTLNALYLLRDRISPSQSLKQFIAAHCRRIESTLAYGLSQDNNHGISEAAGLYIGGAWLASQSAYKSQAQRWKRKGQKWLENRCARLIARDGSFSMYSVNYHRMVLNTLVMAEFWCRALNQEKFSQRFQDKAQALTRCLYQVTDNLSGKAPNLGNNDGSNPFILQPSSDYTDYRPAIQCAACLFYGALAYEPNELVNEPLNYLGIDAENLQLWDIRTGSQVMPDFGLVIFRPAHWQTSHAFLKYPVPQFRAAQADLLHFDLWMDGENILGDAGSWSYCSAEPKTQAWFSSIEAHNTVQIDESEPMPRLGPFLYGNWLSLASQSSLVAENSQLSWSGSCQWPGGAIHHREIRCVGNTWIIADRVTGARKCIVLRWRLAPSFQVLEGNCISSGKLLVSLQEKNQSPFTLSLEQAWESPYYNIKQPVPLLLVQTDARQIHFITRVSRLVPTE